MAIDIQDGGLIAGRLQKLLGLQGRVAPSLEEFIVPTIQVADLAKGALPPESRSCVSAFAQAAVAAQNATWRLDVPPSVLAHIRKITLSVGVGGPLLINFTSTIAAPAGVAIGAFTDARVALTALPASVLFFGTQAAVLANPYRRDFQGAGSFEVAPDGWFIGGSRTVFGFLEGQFLVNNTAAQVVVEWDEYQIF